MEEEEEEEGRRGLRLRVLGLGEVSSLQRDTIKIETRRQTEKNLESQTVEVEVEEKKKKDNKNYQRSFA